MPTLSSQPDLIISLSQDRVKVNLSGNTETGRAAWQTSFKVDSIFLEEQIASSLDSALLENPSLMDQFQCVEVVVLDRPNICLPQHYLDSGILGDIAAKYFRLRAGDTLTTDPSENEAVICYTLPTKTMTMLKEYYANINCHHLTTVLWSNFSSQQIHPEKDSTRLYIILASETLILLGEKNKKLNFSKTFNIRDEADLVYYSIACSRMLKAKENWFVTIADEKGKFVMPDDSLFRIDHQLSLPSLQMLMSQYKVCES
ncbi:MAG: DUF3822 family protein [Saprospiraceae bacterium]